MNSMSLPTIISSLLRISTIFHGGVGDSWSWRLRKYNVIGKKKIQYYGFWLLVHKVLEKYYDNRGN